MVLPPPQNKTLCFNYIAKISISFDVRKYAHIYFIENTKKFTVY